MSMFGLSVVVRVFVLPPPLPGTVAFAFPQDLDLHMVCCRP